MKMKKQILSMLLVLCVSLSVMPVTAKADPVYVAKNLSTGVEYATLQAAVDAATGGAIQLQQDVTESLNISSTNTYSISLDLNGRILSGGSAMVIRHYGKGTLTITDSGIGGKVTSANSSTIYLNGGSLVIAGGTVENTAPDNYYVARTIENYSTGSVSVLGGTIMNSHTGGVVIDNRSTGNVNISGGTLNSRYRTIVNGSTGSVNVSGGELDATNGQTIFNQSGNVNISGGMVSSTYWNAIYNKYPGKITISGNATITSGDLNFGTIYLYTETGTTPKTVLEITGGRVLNTSEKNAIYNYGPGIISIPSGTAIIMGPRMAMNKAPDLSSYTNVQITASTTKTDGTETSVINKTSLNDTTIENYKYLKFEQVTTTAADNITMTNAASVQVNTDLSLAGNVTPSNATNKTIVWSVDNAGGTGATISENIFRATAAGTATIKASIANGLAPGSDYTKTFSITVTTSITPGGSGDYGNAGSGTSKKTEGKIEKDQKKDANAPAASLNDSSQDLKTKILSVAEQAQVAGGADAKIILKIEDISSSVSNEDKKRIAEKLATQQKSLEDKSVLYIDLSIYKKVGNGEETKVTQTNGKINISIEVPKSMRSAVTGVDRTYRVVRVHNGVAQILEGTYNPATHLFTFETDRFSTYALTYQDENTTSKEDNVGTSDQFTVVNDFNHLRLTAKAAKNSQKLSFNKVSGADGYLIYGALCGQDFKKLADVKGNITSYTVKKLKEARYYKFVVKAYKIVDGKKVIMVTSKQIRSVTTSKTYGNPTKVTTKSSSITLKTGKTSKVSYQVVLPKNRKMKDYASLTRFESTNETIATIDSNGKIAAKSKGSCSIYVYAQNGVYTKIKVVVKE